MKKSGGTAGTAQMKKLVVALVKQWADIVASPSELTGFRNALTNIAEDFSLSPSELRALAGRSDAADELYCLLAALRINSSALAAREPRLMQDLKRVCSMCDHKCECDCDIAAELLVKNYQRYCENADRLRSLPLDPNLYVNS